MNLLDMLENRAGQDLTDHIMCYLPDQEHAHRMHLVSKRMHSLVPRNSVPVKFNMRDMANVAVRTRYLQHLDDRIRTVSNVRSFCVHMQNVASAEDANDVLSEFLKLKTRAPRALSGLYLYMPESKTIAHAETLMTAFLSPHTPQSNLGLTGLELSFHDNEEMRAPEFVRRLTQLEHLALQDRHIRLFSAPFQDLVGLKSLVIYALQIAAPGYFCCLPMCVCVWSCARCGPPPEAQKNRGCCNLRKVKTEEEKLHSFETYYVLRVRENKLPCPVPPKTRLAKTGYWKSLEYDE